MTTGSIVPMGQLDYKALFVRIANSRRDLYVTGLTPAGVSTFSSDNLLYFYSWSMLQLAEVNRPDVRREYSISLVIRQLAGLKDAAPGLPIKRVGGCLIGRQGLMGLSADQMKMMHTTDAQTGREINLEPGVTFVDWDWLIEHI
jgi:hypothetical protein